VEIRHSDSVCAFRKEERKLKMKNMNEFLGGGFFVFVLFVKGREGKVRSEKDGIGMGGVGIRKRMIGLSKVKGINITLSGKY
jgi:hypothetical protein